MDWEKFETAMKESPPSSTALGRRFADIVSVAGSWAMRPEMAMAALFFVMTGTSVLLLRGKSSRAPANAEIIVTEEGSPAPASVSLPPPSAARSPAATASASWRSNEHGTALSASVPPAARGTIVLEDPRAPPKASTPLPPPPARSAASAREEWNEAAQPVPPVPSAVPANATVPIAPAADAPGPYAAALASYQAGRFDDARRTFDAMAPGDPSADLWAARSVREERGCRAAIARFDRVAQRAAGTSPGWDALLEGGRCRAALGDYAGARSRFEQLLDVDSRRDPARAELDRIARAQPGSRRP